MRREKFLLLLIASTVGLLVAGVAFYIYESSKTIPTEKIKKVVKIVPTPTPKPSIYLNISSPKNELVVDKKILTVSGKTVPNSNIIVLSPIDESAGSTSSDGNFSTTVNLEDDQNIIRITAIAPNGETITEARTVTYSTESF